MSILVTLHMKHSKILELQKPREQSNISRYYTIQFQKQIFGKKKRYLLT